jgi:hypothetical protein
MSLGNKFGYLPSDKMTVNILNRISFLYKIYAFTIRSDLPLGEARIPVKHSSQWVGSSGRPFAQSVRASGTIPD